MNLVGKKYLFICGCARSGTSVTTELILRHSKIALGRERFNSLFKNNKINFTPSLFTPQRFCKSLQQGDTHHTKLNEYYDSIFSKWDNHFYYGDKIPSLFKEYDYLINTFEQPKIFFLLRNIFDVSQSWERRRLHSVSTNGKWPHDRGFIEAIMEWNISLKNTIDAKEKYPDNIFIIPYSKLFSDYQLLIKIFEYINIEITQNVINYWNESAAQKKELEQKRIIQMPTEVKDSIHLKADFHSFRKLYKMAGS